jgi:hypothetical protein
LAAIFVDVEVFVACEMVTLSPEILIVAVAYALRVEGVTGKGMTVLPPLMYTQTSTFVEYEKRGPKTPKLGYESEPPTAVAND